ncbi:geranylgeranyl reductase family protein [Acidobacteriota bacterium]
MAERLVIYRGKCCYCGGCVGVCPEDALLLVETELKVDEQKCTLCGYCISFCPVEALSAPAEELLHQMPEEDTISTDVVVVGAGPAGSICAKYLAQSGVDVLVIEKKQEIGVPKRCAEAVDIQVFKEVGIKTNPQWMLSRIQTAVLYAPNGNNVQFSAQSTEESGCIVERKIFEKHLAKDAIQAGARYMLKTTALAVKMEKNQVTGIIADHMGVKREIEAKIVIAADGVDSMMSKSAGLDTVNRLKNYMSCFQYEMAGIDNIAEEAIHMYYGNSIAPGGYVWIFPKGNGLANVGVGIKVQKEGDKTPKKHLDEFIEKNPKIFKRASAVEFNCGGVPVKQTVETLVGDGLMIIGDAAQLVNPISGGGLTLAMISGKMAAEVGASCLRKGDFSAHCLNEYQKNWNVLQGKELKRMLKLQRFTEKLSDNDLNNLADILTEEILEELARGIYSGFIKLLMKKLPSLMPYAVKFLKS